MRTLRARVLTVAVVVLAATVGLLVALTAGATYQRAVAVLDGDLERQLVHVLTEAADRSPALVLAEEPPASRVTTFLVGADGGIVVQSRGPEDIATAVAGQALPTSLGARPTQVPLGDTTLRAVGQQIGPTQWVVVAGEYDAVRTQALTWAGLIAAVGGLCLVVGGLVMSLALSRTVQPVRDLARDTARTVPGRLSPVPVPAGPSEATTLATELNVLLAQIRAEQARRNEFMATVSHEMRTPLTIARGQLEALALYGATDEQDVRSTTQLAVAEIGRASRLLDGLLHLARSAEPGYVCKEPEYLPGLAADLRLRLAALPGDVTVVEPSAATVDLDRERVGQAVLNCVVNATAHNAEPVRVEVAFTHSPVALQITVDDSGAGWPTDREHVLDPFVSPGGSTGLGLAVVRAVAHAHRGRVALEESPLGGARVRLILPTV